MSDAITSLIDGIMYAVKTLINKAEYDQTVSGHILYYAGNNKYVVKVNGENYTVKSNGIFNSFDSVEITKPKNKWLNAYISYPNTVNVNVEDLSSESESLRQASEEIRIANEIERIEHEEMRHEYYTDFVTKSESYDVAEKNREDSCADAVRAITDVKTAIENSYAIISDNADVIIQNCNNVAKRCEEAAQICYDIASNGYVTNDVLSDYVRSETLTNTLSNYAKIIALNNYITSEYLTNTLSNYIKISDIDNYITKTDVNGLYRIVQENGRVYLEVI